MCAPTGRLSKMPFAGTRLSLNVSFLKLIIVFSALFDLVSCQILPVMQLTILHA